MSNRNQPNRPSSSAARPPRWATATGWA